MGGQQKSKGYGLFYSRSPVTPVTDLTLGKVADL